MASQPEPVPDLILELYAQGELPPDEMAALGRRMATDTALAGRLEQLQASNEEILREHPADLFAAAVARRIADSAAGTPATGTRKTRPRLAWVLLTPVLITALLVVFLQLGPDRATDSPSNLGQPTETIYTKGLVPNLRIYRQGREGVERLAPGAVVRQRDLLQISYVAGDASYGAILSIDGRGTVTLHYPDHAARATDLAQTGETAIAHAYELDDAPGFERFVFVTADVPIPVADLMRAARELAGDPERARTAALALPATFQQMFLLVRKEETRD